MEEKRVKHRNTKGEREREVTADLVSGCHEHADGAEISDCQFRKTRKEEGECEGEGAGGVDL